MKQIQWPVIAYGLLFTTKFSTARYLLVDIDDGAIGAGERSGNLGILDLFRNILIEKAFIAHDKVILII